MLCLFASFHRASALSLRVCPPQTFSWSQIATFCWIQLLSIRSFPFSSQAYVRSTVLLMGYREIVVVAGHPERAPCWSQARLPQEEGCLSHALSSFCHIDCKGTSWRHWPSSCFMCLLFWTLRVLRLSERALLTLLHREDSLRSLLFLLPNALLKATARIDLHQSRRLGASWGWFSQVSSLHCRTYISVSSRGSL